MLSLHHAGRRALALGGALAALAPAVAGAATTRVSDVVAADVTADGRQILLVDGTVLTARTGALVGPAPGTTVDLASDSATVLYAAGEDWFVRDLAAAGAPASAVNRTPDGARVGIGAATLIRNGRAVTFSTTETPSRILTIDVGAARSVELLRDAALVRASDDGRVVAFSRTLADAPRPRGTTGQGARATLPGNLTGYLVRGRAPRVVGVTHWIEHLGAPDGTVPCGENPVEYDRTATTISLAQDGLGGGRYLVPVTTTVDRSAWPGPGLEISRRWQDPYSAATTEIVDAHPSYPLWNRWSLSSGQAAPGADPQLIPPPGSTDPAGLATVLLAYGGGGGAVLSATPRAGGGPATFVTDGPALAPSAESGWTALPRPSDPVLTGRERIGVTWASCRDPRAPTPSPTVSPRATPRHGHAQRGREHHRGAHRPRRR